MSDRMSKAIADCRNGLGILGTEDSVRYETVQHFIRHAAYWNHPRAGWVRAPKHAERIVEGLYGWELSFGANFFFVELALKGCINEVNVFLNEASVEIDGDEPNYRVLLHDLALRIRSAVGNHLGQCYSGHYPEHEGFMMFGTQGIYLPSFVGIVIATGRLPQHFTAQ